MKSKHSFLIILTFAYTFFSCVSHTKYTEEETYCEIEYTNEDGETYSVPVVPTQVLIMFHDWVTETEQRQIIKELGGDILDYFPMLDSYLVATKPQCEMIFINCARQYRQVEDVHPNVVYDCKSVDMYIIDSFEELSVTDNKNNVCLSHGDYCVYAARTAYPERPENIIKKGYEFFPSAGERFFASFTGGIQKKHLDNIFNQSDSNSLILINMSYGPKLGARNRQLWDESTDSERYNWTKAYLDDIRHLANDIEKLVRHNPNVIIFKAAGNEACHNIDEIIFNNLYNKLTLRQHKNITNHVLFVCAKDDNYSGIEKLPIDKSKLYAYYSNSPSKYNPCMTMVDISHLDIPGTSFAAPFLLGKVARKFDIEGYKPINSLSRGWTVTDMIRHIKKNTREYATNIQQPGLYTDIKQSKPETPKNKKSNFIPSKGCNLSESADDFGDTTLTGTIYETAVGLLNIPEYYLLLERPITKIGRHEYSQHIPINNQTKVRLPNNFAELYLKDLVGKCVTVRGVLIEDYDHKDAIFLMVNLNFGFSLTDSSR